MRPRRTHDGCKLCVGRALPAERRNRRAVPRPTKKIFSEQEVYRRSIWMVEVVVGPVLAVVIARITASRQVWRYAWSFGFFAAAMRGGVLTPGVGETLIAREVAPGGNLLAQFPVATGKGERVNRRPSGAGFLQQLYRPVILAAKGISIAKHADSAGVVGRRA